MELRPTGMAGCLELQCLNLQDLRGRFVKTFQAEWFAAQGLRTDWREEYYSVSARDVLRGMHFQVPPAEHAKLVYCLAGRVLDVVVDLRVGSPTFRQVRALELSPEQGNALYIPVGVAHGFLSLSDQSVMQYKVTSGHDPACDAGVLWSSLDVAWPVGSPILSERDQRHPALQEFVSPFVFAAADGAPSAVQGSEVPRGTHGTGP